MIKTDIQLQQKMINRQLKDFALHPAAGYLLLLLAFTGLPFSFVYNTFVYSEIITTFV